MNPLVNTMIELQSDAERSRAALAGELGEEAQKHEQKNAWCHKLAVRLPISSRQVQYLLAHYGGNRAALLKHFTDKGCEFPAELHTEAHEDAIPLDEATQRHLKALSDVGIEQPREILNRLSDLTKRLPVSLNDLVTATVKACRQHSEPEGVRPQISNIILIEPAAQPLNLIQFTARLQATSDDLARFIEQMPGPPPKRSKNKRGQRSQQKPWHPKFRRIS